MDAHNPGIEIIHHGGHKSLPRMQRRWLKRRQAVEPVIGHLKANHRMSRCWLHCSLGDALNAVLCAVGYNLRWLLRAIARKALKGIFCAWRMGAVEAHGVRVIVVGVVATIHSVISRGASLISRWLLGNEFRRGDYVIERAASTLALARRLRRRLGRALAALKSISVDWSVRRAVDFVCGRYSVLTRACTMRGIP